MKLADVAIRRPVLTLVIAISTIVFGVIGYLGMGIDLYPEIEFPVITITAQLEGASPEVVELTVTKVIEDEVATLDKIESLTSQSSFGSATVVVEFALDKDIDVAVQEVRDRIAVAQRILPEDIEPPLIQKINISDQPIMWVAATTRGDYWALAQWVDQVAQDRLIQIEGVGSVLLGAFRSRAYRVWLDPAALKARGIEPLEVAAAIRAEHVELPAGRAEGPHLDVSLRVFGEFESAEALGSLILAGGPEPVRLRDVARVEAGLEEARSIARFNGLRSVGMGVRKQSGSNTVEVAERVKEFLPRLQALAPPGVDIDIAFDSSRFIRSSITGVQFDIVFGAVLTILVVFLFLRSARATLITALAIPTSLVSTFALMNAFGFTMNNLTMLGLSLAVGMVIDDAIVVVENVYRQLERGKSRMQAAHDAMNEIGFAVIVSTVSIAAVFVPIAYMKGIMGRFFFQFGLTVAFALLVSMVIALTLSPMLAARLLGGGEDTKRMRPWTFRIASVLAGVLVAALVWRFLDDRPAALLVLVAFVVFAIVRGPFEPAYKRLEAGYRRVLPWIMRHRFATLGVATLLFAGAAAVAATPMVPKQFAAQADEGRFLVRFQSPVGTSLESTDVLARKVDDVLAKHDAIAGRFVAAGFGGGGSPKPNFGIAFINLKPHAQRDVSQGALMASLRAELNQIPGLVAFVDNISPIGGGQRTADIQYVLEGPDVLEISQWADAVIARMGEAGGFVGMDADLELTRPEARIRIDRERAELLGLSARRITDTINMMMGGSDVAFFKEGGERYDIRLRAELSDVERPADLLPLPIKATSGALVPLASAVTVEEGVGPDVIPRYNRQRAVTLYSNLSGKPLGEALEELVAFVREERPPSDLYTSEPAGVSKTFQEAFRYLLQALALSVLIVYLVLAAQFESFLHPLTIMMSLPLAVIGVVVGLASTGLSLDVFSFIGIVMLVGIVTKNGILLVDYTQHLRGEGIPRDEALLQAGPTRMRPVLMTALTTAAGMIPVALAYSEGAETRASMGMAVIGGMLSATPLTLLVIPVVYTVSDDAVTWGHRHAAGLRRAATVATAAGLLAAAVVGLVTGTIVETVLAGLAVFALALLVGTAVVAWRGRRAAGAATAE